MKLNEFMKFLNNNCDDYNEGTSVFYKDYDYPINNLVIKDNKLILDYDSDKGFTFSLEGLICKLEDKIKTELLLSDELEVVFNDLIPVTEFDEDSSADDIFLS
jgi:hypothetical protein